MRNPIRLGVQVLAFALLLAVVPSGPAAASPGLATEDLSGPLTPEDLANSLVGSGVTISNVTYTGADVAAGTFGGGTGIIGFESGIVLSSGDIANVVGPNVDDGITGTNSTAGDSDLDTLSGFTTFDAAVLEFDFVPGASTVFFQYVFASDEYNEFVNSQFNDVFAFFVNGTNCATVNGDPVSINTINNGNPFGTDPRSHPELYINNDLDDGGGSIDTEMDGLTAVLTCQASVTAGETNHMKLAIADASDDVLDSNVFLQGGSFTTNQPLTTTKTADSATSSPGAANGYTITFSNPNENDVTLNSITDTLPDGFTYMAGSSSGATTADPSINGQTLTWTGPFTAPGSGQLSLHFGVAVSTVPGDYFNQAGGSAQGAVVNGTGPTAQITVQEETPTETITQECSSSERCTVTLVGTEKTTILTVPPKTPGGTATISHVAGLPSDCPDFDCFGQTSIIDTTFSATPRSPFRIVFKYPAFIVPDDLLLSEIEVFHDGERVPPCDNQKGIASPDPCVLAKRFIGPPTEFGRALSITVLSTTNGRWRN